MPRGGKGPGKTMAAPKAPAKKTPIAKQEPAPAKAGRKGYPSMEERIALADRRIEHLNKLLHTRGQLIEKTEAVQNARKAAQAKNSALLEKTLSRKERLTAAKDKPAKAAAPKLSPEELKIRRAETLAKARAAKKAEKAKYDQLLAALKVSGKSVDELLQDIKE